MKKLLLATSALVAFGAGPAHADPVSAAIAVAAIGGSYVATGALATALFQIGLSAALSSVLSKVATNKSPKTDVQMEMDIGDDTALTFCVGSYATAGKRKYIGSWGKNNRYITEVIEVSCLPQALAGFWVNDERADIDWSGEWDQGGHNVGYSIRNYNRDGYPRIWFRYHDGTQTVADPLMTGVFGGDADYPWTAEFIGTGKSYVVVTSCYDKDTLASYPNFTWEPAPLPMYDPRKDSTVGGVGGHRWGDRSTYEASVNNAVVCYNIARGIYYGNEWVFGGKNMAAWRLPFDEWVSAMNACDAQVQLETGGYEPAYRCGLQVEADNEPLSVMEEIGKAGNMRFAEVGGMLKPLVGLPGASVFSITDDDIVITEGQSFTPFSPVSDVFNALSATYPEPGEKWATKDAPEYISDYWTAEDGGRYLPTSLAYGAAPFADQVQRLMRSQMEDYRRMRRHTFQIHPGAYALEPLDMITWDSQRNGYEGKAFVVESVAKLPGMCVAVTLRECDPSDYDWSTDFELPYTVVPPSNIIPWTQQIDGWKAEAITLKDSTGLSRSAAIRVWCDGDETGVASVRIQIRREGDAVTIFDVTRPYDEPYAWVITDVTPMTTFGVRGCLLSDIGGVPEWSEWITVTTDNITVSLADISEDLQKLLDTLEEWVNSGSGDLVGVIQDLTDRIADEEAARVADAELAAQRWQETGTALAGLGNQISAQEAARVSDAELSAQRLRDLRDTVRKISAEVVELSSTGQVAMDELRRGIAVQLGDLRASYDEQILVLAGADKAMAVRIETLEADTGDMSADIVSLRQAVADTDEALAQTADQLGTRIDDAERGVSANTDAVDGLSSRTAVTEGKIVTQGEAISGLQGQITDPETGLSALAEGIDRLTTEVEQGQGGTLALHSEAIRVLRNTIRAVAAEQVEAGARNEQAQQELREYTAEASQSLNTRIDLTDAQVSIVSEAVTALKAAIPGLATATALQALQTVVTQQAGLIEASGTALTQLSSALDALTGVVGGKASADAVAGLTTRVTDAEGKIDAQGQSLTQLGSRVSGNESAIAGVSGAIGGLSTRVAQTENGLAVQGEDITALQGQVTDPETGLDALAEGIERLTTEAEQNEEGTSVQSEAIRVLRNTIRAIAAEQVEAGARNEEAQNDLREYTSEASQSLNSRIDVTDDQVRIVAEAVTALKAAIPGLATATALQALQTVVTQQGAQISASSTALTQLSAALDALSGALSGKADASAVTALQARVDQTEDAIQSQASSLTNLSSSLTATNGNVAAAQQAAQSASTLAGSKGKVIVQSAAPATADRLAQNLWIDTTGGANTPKRWNGTAWVAVTDKVATDAAAAAANALAVAGTKADASAVQQLQTTVTQQGDQIQAQAQSLTQVSAELGESNAQGIIKMEAVATPSTSRAKAAIYVRVGNEVVTSAGLYLQVENDGRQLVVLDANTVLVTGGNNVVFPFVIIDGVTYIRSAMIADASITSAKIGSLAVDTIHIKDAAVTKVLYAEGENSNENISSFADLANFTFTIPSGVNVVMLQFEVRWRNVAGGGKVFCRGYVDGESVLHSASENSQGVIVEADDYIFVGGNVSIGKGETVIKKNDRPYTYTVMTALTPGTHTMGMLWLSGGNWSTLYGSCKVLYWVK